MFCLYKIPENFHDIKESSSYKITFLFYLAGKIAVGVLVPIFVIGALLGFLFYRRYKQRQSNEERIAFSNQAFQSTPVAETDIDESSAPH